MSVLLVSVKYRFLASIYLNITGQIFYVWIKLSIFNDDFPEQRIFVVDFLRKYIFCLFLLGRGLIYVCIQIMLDRQDHAVIFNSIYAPAFYDVLGPTWYRRRSITNHILPKFYNFFCVILADFFELVKRPEPGLLKNLWLMVFCLKWIYENTIRIKITTREIFLWFKKIIFGQMITATRPPVWWLYGKICYNFRVSWNFCTAY